MSATRSPVACICCATAARFSSPGHQNSTAPKFRWAARSNRSRNGTSFNRIEIFTSNCNIRFLSLVSGLVAFHLLEDNILCTFPQHQSPKFLQLLIAAHDGQEVISCQLSEFTGEASATIGKENFCLAEPSRIEEYLTRAGVARMVLEAHAKLKIAQWDPGGFPAPARLNDLAAKWQDSTERLTGVWGICLLQARGEFKRAGGNT